MKKKILVTGASGFIGFNLIKKLKNKKVIAVSRSIENTKHKNCTYLSCDLKSRSKVFKLFKKIKPDIVYHLAWEGIPNFNNRNFEKNKKITKNIIFAINNTECKKVIISGSCSEYNYINTPKKLMKNQILGTYPNLVIRKKLFIKFLIRA